MKNNNKTKDGFKGIIKDSALKDVLIIIEKGDIPA